MEGFPGQGKQKVINYISDLLNYDIENIIITNNLSVEDLFKKTILESKEDGTFSIDVVDTKLNKVIYSKSHYNSDEKSKNKKPILFVFHNIHKARADVLSKLSIILNKKCVNSKYFFIGLINIKESFIERKEYYYKYFYNSVYYIVNPTVIDISFYKKIQKVNKEKENDIDISILEYFKQKNDNGIDFTITDFTKFISLKKESNFDTSFLEEIVFKNRKYLENIRTERNQNDNFNEQRKIYDLDINYKNGTKELLFELNKKSISLETLNILDTFDIEKNTLSFEQKKCLIVLGLAVKSKLPFILQGDTGVGKSHLIKLFAKILGKKLHIIGLNKDNDISVLTKRYIFKKYSENEEKDIETTVNELLEGKKDMINLDLYEKIKKIKLIESDLDKNKKEKFDELK